MHTACFFLVLNWQIINFCPCYSYITCQTCTESKKDGESIKCKCAVVCLFRAGCCREEHWSYLLTAKEAIKSGLGSKVVEPLPHTLLRMLAAVWWSVSISLLFACNVVPLGHFRCSNSRTPARWCYCTVLCARGSWKRGKSNNEVWQTICLSVPQRIKEVILSLSDNHISLWCPVKRSRFLFSGLKWNRNNMDFAAQPTVAAWD